MSSPDTPKRIGMVSLGCPKATVDSERILTGLRAEGYEISSDYENADLVVVNTCGFIESAVDESLDAIGEAMAENGKVIVTGCLGAREDVIRESHPDVLSISGPQAYESVMAAVHQELPKPHDPFTSLIPASGIKLTPRHYAYLKISEGCNHHCSFCIIPSMRGRLVSRPAEDVLREAELLVNDGVKELLVVSQDTSAYGSDLKYRSGFYGSKPVRSHITDLSRALGELGAWVRLHYVYPYPHVNELIPLMAEGLVLPYLDIPFQHSDPAVLKNMRRPASSENVLKRIREYREICPDITLRSTFIVGFPGETEAQFENLLDFLDEAQLDRVGCFTYSPVEGATANDIDGAVPEEVQEERLARFMEKQAEISAAKLEQKIDQEITVIVDGYNGDDVIARSQGDAPEIDGQVIIEDEPGFESGQFLKVRITEAGEHDLWADLIEEI